MTVGIKPTRPDTGYGYIQVSDANPVSRVKCFTEKPDLELAQVFLRSGEFLWNSGIFVWTVRAIVAAFEKYLPEHHALFSGLERALGTEAEQNIVEMVFAECRAISIDYGIMEKADNVYVRRGEFGWSDVGTWGSVYQHARKDRYANAGPGGEVFAYDTRNSLISLPRQDSRCERLEGLYRGRYRRRAADMSQRGGAEHQALYRRRALLDRRRPYLAPAASPRRTGAAPPRTTLILTLQ